MVQDTFYKIQHENDLNQLGERTYGSAETRHVTGSILSICWAFLSRPLHAFIIRWMDAMYAQSFLTWTLVIQSAFVPHLLGIRLIRQNFIKKSVFGQDFVHIWPLLNFQEKQIVR